eukprot:Gb_12164 [translate_table: standard]
MSRGKGNRIAQVILLKRIIRRCHRMANARKAVAAARFSLSPKKWRYSTLDMDAEERCRSSAIPADVPKGHIPVYVGSERSRFVIPTTYLSHPLFRALLQKAEDEFGFDHPLGLTLPCDDVAFEYLTSLLQSKDPILMKLDLDELIDFHVKERDSRQRCENKLQYSQYGCGYQKSELFFPFRADFNRSASLFSN